MQRYTIQKNDNKFNIMEQNNDRVIESYEHYKDAKRIKHLLNNGSGFNGFTPTFFTENRLSHKYKAKKLNED